MIYIIYDDSFDANCQNGWRRRGEQEALTELLVGRINLPVSVNNL